ncbi:WD40-repeat-containing domain protein [Kockovaella imperatae]|uniref:WD40-repeat-containing domain protein n=1 Tax=Kockovaella imperatae TaxID=4999 RepID=A0A1Y1UCZ7_9TREE|nr:WD40-repeat-containing domain protein [Kockovaella imperatae]ORX34945.1 WD40-repeat-containing domain protein [Kockovaella imperatae]
MNHSAWSHRPPSPPSSTHSDPFSRAFSSLSMASGSTTPYDDASEPSHRPSPLDIPSSSSSMSRPTTPRPVQIPMGPGGGVLSPPTPAPSPNPRDRNWGGFAYAGDHDKLSDETQETRSDPGQHDWKGKSKADEDVSMDASDLIERFKHLSTSQRFAFLSSLVDNLALPEALVLSRNIEPKLRRDFLRELPIELALHVLSFIDDAKSLARASQVSRYWSQLLADEGTWKEMCQRQYGGRSSSNQRRIKNLPGGYPNRSTNLFRGVDVRTPIQLSDMWAKDQPAWGMPPEISYRQQYKTAYQTESNWLQGGRVLARRSTGEDSVVTTLSFDENLIVIGMAKAKVIIFDSNTGQYCRTLKGHDGGVWASVLVSPMPKSRIPAGPPSDISPRFKRQQTSTNTRSSSGAQFRRSTSFSAAQDSTGPSASQSYQSFFGQATSSFLAAPKTEEASGNDPCNSARGWWGLNRPIVVSGGCDREVKVWDASTGACIYALRGHTSTVRCLKVIDGKPLAVSGSRDSTVRVWDIEKGQLVHTMTGHLASVRCLDVSGSLAVSGSYDYTCRVWNVETGRCLHTLRGHYHQIYAVAFQGDRIVTGSLDSTVRIWSAATGQCTALLQGHTSLVGQLQLCDDRLVTGGSDGRVISFDLASQKGLHRLCAHDNSVTCLQFDHRFIVSGGNDGRVKLWNMQTGKFIRELTKPCDAVWRVAFRDDKCAILLQREGETVLEVITFRPDEVRGQKLVPRIKQGLQAR